MAMQSNVDTEYPSLAEFVDDASEAKSEITAAEAGLATAMRDVVRRNAIVTGVPRFKLDEIVERVLATAGKEVEDLLRKEIRVVLREYRPKPSPKPDEKLSQEIKSDRSATV